MHDLSPFLQAYAASLGIPFLETSAKDNTNIEAIFMSMAVELIKNKLVVQ